MPETKIGSRTLPGIGGTRLLDVFWPKGSPWGSIFEIILVPSSIKNAVKNRSRNRVSKKHEKHKKQSKERCEKQWTIHILFMKKEYAKYANALFFPYRSSISSKSKCLKSLLVIENSIQNHVRKVDVRIIEKSLKNRTKMKPKPFQNRWKIC